MQYATRKRALKGAGRIHVFALAEVTAISGQKGDYTVSVKISALCEPLDFHLRNLFDDMISGRYHFPGESDLPFMAVVQPYGRAIPFRILLETNRTHKRGF